MLKNLKNIQVLEMLLMKPKVILSFQKEKEELEKIIDEKNGW